MEAVLEKTLQEFVDSIEIPIGFKKEVDLQERKHNWQDGPKAILKSEDVEIHLDISVMMKKNKPDLSVTGSTKFIALGKMFSFDRIGIDNSFYLSHDGYDPIPSDVNKVVVAQIQRAKEGIKDMSEKIQVPELGFYISKEKQEKMSKLLKAGKSTSLTPSGFGIGYQLIGRRVRTTQWGPKVASDVLKKFFKVTTLYIDTMDCD